MRKNEVSVYAAAMLWALALQGCGGGASTAAAPAAVTLGGTAAVGAPIVGATIGLVCAGGVALTSAPTSSTGAWQLTLGSQALPCAAKLSGGTVNGNTNTVQYHSIATSAGTMNITPLTDLLVANMAGVAPATWFAGLPTNNALAAVNAASVTAALTQLRAGLALTQLTTVNPIVLPFSPVAGNLMDDPLSSLQTAL